MIKMPDADDVVQKKVVKIDASKGESAIFIHRIVWGMTGGSRIVFITERSGSDLSPVSASDYIYNGLSELFYKQTKDTITIYTSEPAPVPPEWKGEFRIVQVELANRDMMRLIHNDNYRKENLTLIE
jgi:hypothetical protein